MGWAAERSFTVPVPARRRGGRRRRGAGGGGGRLAPGGAGGLVYVVDLGQAGASPVPVLPPSGVASPSFGGDVAIDGGRLHRRRRQRRQGVHLRALSLLGRSPPGASGPSRAASASTLTSTGSLTIVGAVGFGPKGAVHAFRRGPGGWSSDGTLFPVDNSTFGSQVALAGATVAVRVPVNGDDAAGEVRFYDRIAPDTWTPGAPTLPMPGFGAVAFDGASLVANLDDEFGNDDRARVIEHAGAGWATPTTLTAPPAVEGGSRPRSPWTARWSCSVPSLEYDPVTYAGYGGSAYVYGPGGFTGAVPGGVTAVAGPRTGRPQWRGHRRQPHPSRSPGTSCTPVPMAPHRDHDPHRHRRPDDDHGAVGSGGGRPTSSRWPRCRARTTGLRRHHRRRWSSACRPWNELLVHARETHRRHARRRRHHLGASSTTTEHHHAVAGFCSCRTTRSPANGGTKPSGG